MESWVVGGVGVTLGFFLAWLLGRSSKCKAVNELNGKLTGAIAKSEGLEERLIGAEMRLKDAIGVESGLRSECLVLSTKLEMEQRLVGERADILGEAKSKLSDAFKVLSADALRANQAQFLEMAKTMFHAQQEVVEQKMDQRLSAIEELVDSVSERFEKVELRSEEKESKGEKMLEPSLGFDGFADVGGMEDGFEGFLAESEGEGI